MVPPLLETIPVTTPDPAPTVDPPPWPAVDLARLDETCPALPNLPLDVLPPWWRTWVIGTAQGVGAPEDYVLQALLAAVAGICGAGVVGRVTDTWNEPLVLWQALVGGPSNGKTSALEALRRPLAIVEKQLSVAGRGAPIVVEEAALPALMSAATKRPAGVLLWCDEPSAWLATLGRQNPGEARRRSTLLDAWAPMQSASAPLRPAVSIVGSLDAARLAEALSSTGDGRAARFLYAWPQATTYRSFLLAEAAAESDAVNALQRLANLSGDPARPLALVLDAEAQQTLDRYLAELHAERSRAAGFLAAWLGKGRGTVVRLAAILTLLAWTANTPATAAPPNRIGRDALLQAFRLWERFRLHARAVFQRADPSHEERRLRRVLAWIRDNDAAVVSREEVRREALSQAVDATGSQAVIAELERAGILRRTDPDPEGRGPRRHRWQVNPLVHASG
jgi:hypothetical protein